MTDVNTAAPAAEAAPAKAKAKKTTAKKALKKGAAERATKVSAAAAKDRAAKAKKQTKADRAISAGRKPAKDSKQPAGPRPVLGHALNTKITYGTGEDGKKYSQANCPKRAGTGAEKEWRKYAKAAMTIQGAMDAGIPRTFVLHDLRYGYMTVAK